MAKHLDIQKRAQEELDRVIGSERLPQISDQTLLPYVEAVVMECFRWNPIIPLAFPHVAAADDEYKGYFIPKGSLVIGNSWCVNQSRPASLNTCADVVPQVFVSRPVSLPRPGAVRT